MIEKPANTTYEIHPLLRDRWSPRAFSPEPLPAEQVLSLFEAARWSPSALNEQPWHFIAVPRSDEQGFAQAVSCLMEGNVPWAQHAPVLIVAVARTTFSRDGKPNQWAVYDLGQAVAHLTVQAAAQGLWVHQMAGFVPERTREVFGIPEDHAPVTFIAVGRRGDPDALPEQLRQRELAARERRPLEGSVFGTAWGQPSPLLAAGE